MFLRLIFCISFAVPAGAAVNRHALLEKLPVRFEQSGSDRFVARGIHQSIELTRKGNAIRWAGRECRRNCEVVTRLVDASPRMQLEPREPVAARTSYILGSDPHKWRTAITSYREIRYRNVYAGIDLVYYGTEGTLEYDFVVQPGADPSAIRFDVEGAQSIAIASTGDLVFKTGSREIRWKKPYIYLADANRTPVGGRFVLQGKRVGFALDDWDRKHALVIDPRLDYSSYLGGSGNEGARAIATDGSGNVYVAGFTTSNDLPVSPTPLQAGYGGHTTNAMTGDGFVAKFNSGGTLQYLTYLGGNADDIITAIAVDSSGNAYVTGFTNSRNFPISTGAYQTAFGGLGGNELTRIGDAFITKIDPTGSRIVYSTYLGGRLDDAGFAIAIDGSGNAVVAGTTLNTDFPTTPGAYQTVHRGAGGQDEYPRYGAAGFQAGDIFVTKLNSTGTALLFSTLFGGSLDEIVACIALDSASNVYIGGSTLSSTNFPTTAGAFQRTFRGIEQQNFFTHLGDGFVAKFNSAGTQLIYSTLLGGSGDDAVTAIALDSAGNAYVTGATTSTDFPTTASVFQRRYGGPTSLPFVADQLIGDAFVTKLNAAGSQLIYSTYLGGSADDAGAAIAIDAGGNAFVAGFSVSTNFPVTADAAQARYGGQGGVFINQAYGDGFLVRLNADASSITYGTYIGGSRDDAILALALDASGNLFVTGNTVSTNFPATIGQRAFAGSNSIGFQFRGDAFLARYSGFPTTTSPTAGAVTALGNGASYVRAGVAPGMLFIIGGSGIGPSTLTSGTIDPSTARQATNVAQTRIFFDDIPAPIIYVSDTQSTGLVPYGVAGKTTTQVSVEYRGVRTTALTVPVVAALPGLLSSDFTGSGQGNIYNEDTSRNSASRPARKNAIIVLYGTGEGQTNPPGVDGLVASSVYPAIALPVSISIGGIDVDPSAISYKGAVPLQVAGIFQINVRVPANVGSGAQPIVVTIGGVKSQANLTVAIE